METDLDRYAWLVGYELREARRAATPEERREHERLARTYAIKMHALENGPGSFLLSDNARGQASRPSDAGHAPQSGGKNPEEA